MPELTTVDGDMIMFTADSVIAIADHDDDTGTAVTCVYGVTQAMLHIAEPVETFLYRVGITQAFAKLTRPNGLPVWIRGNAVLSIRAPAVGEYAGEGKTVIFTSAITQDVKETMPTVAHLIDAHGGAL